jgi:lysophospholipase L1-like esterase
MKLKLIILFVLATAGLSAKAQSGFPFDNEIRDFKKQDSLNMPAKGGILFIGSSSIRKWTDLEQRFSNKPIIRRGVGGCTLEQLVNYYTPYILLPYKPKKVFIYAGENDIAAGKSGVFVAQKFTQLWRLLEKQLPKADIYFMSVKPSPSRAQYYDQVRAANRLIKIFLLSREKGHFIDVSTTILDPVTAKPDPGLFESDMLHLNSRGYDRWQAVLQPYVVN